MQVNYAIGLVEVSSLGHAIIMLDDMLKAADVTFAATERKLGGRLVTIVVIGDISAVNAAVEAGTASAKANGAFKAANVIARPHEEILKFLHLDKEKEMPVNSESAASHVGKLPEQAEKPAAKKAPAKQSRAAAPKEEKKTAQSRRRGRPRKTETK